MNWKSLLWKIPSAIILISMLFFLVDLLYISMLVLVAPNSPEEPQKVVAAWQKELQAQDNEVRRGMVVKVTKSMISFEFAVEVPPSSKIAELATLGSIQKDAVAFVKTIFGTVTIGEGELSEELSKEELSSEEFSTPTWHVDSELNRMTINVKAVRSIEEPTSIQIEIKPSSESLYIQGDRIVIDLSGYHLLRINPVPTDATQTTVIISAEPTSHLADVDLRLQLDSNQNAISRRTFLQKLGNYWSSFLFWPYILYSFVGAGPLLLFLFIVHKKQKKGLRTFVSVLAKLTSGLLLFHFLLFFIQGGEQWFHDGPWIPRFSNWVFQSLRAPSYLQDPSIVEHAGPYRAAIVLLGIMLPTLLLNWWEQPTEKKNYTSGRAALFLFVTLLLIPIIAWLMFIMFPGKDGIAHYIPMYPWWLWIVALSSIILLIILGIIKILQSFFGSIRSFHWQALLSMCVLLALAIFYAYYRLNVIGLSNVRAIIFFVLTIIFGVVLIISLITLVSQPIQKIFVRFRPTGWIKILVVIIALVLSIPMRKFVQSSLLIGHPSDIVDLAAKLDTLIVFVWLAGVIWFLYRRGRWSLQLDSFTHEIGILAAASVLFSITTRWFYIPITFLFGWLLLKYLIRPAQYWADLKPWYVPDANHRNELLERVINLNAAESAHWEHRKKMSESLADGKITPGEFDRQLQKRRAQLDKLRIGSTTVEEKYRDFALSFGPFDSAWKNALHGAIWATIFALPWLALYVRDFLGGLFFSHNYPLLDFVSDSLYVFSHWIGLGFFFGYFYPYFRGRTGVQKGLGLFGVVFLATLPLASIYRTSLSNWQPILLWSLQIFIECLLLGFIAFDYWTLRIGRRGWQMLFEIQGLTLIGISVSSILAAISAAIITLLSTQATNLVGATLQLLVPGLPILPK